MLSNHTWKSLEMSFMTGLKIWKREKVKTDGQSKEDLIRVSMVVRRVQKIGNI